jgi:hypothetical protein
MARELIGPDLSFRYRLIDIRELDGDRLLDSEEVGDNVIAILARLRDDRAAVRRIVQRIAGIPAAGRQPAMSQLLILAGLRKLEEAVEQETRQMPIYIDILENKVLGREFKRGERTLLRGQIEKRFGALPAWVDERLADKTVPELEDLGLRVLDAPSLEDLFK